MAERQIDPAKLRVALQGLNDQQVRYIFEEMIDVLPAWFTCLSATVEPDEHARRVGEMIERHGSYRRDKYLARARRSATPAQRQALRGVS